jgi:hypothetical protein
VFANGGADSIRVRGPRAEILAAYAPAACLHDWQIYKIAGTWTLTAGADRVNPILLRGVLRFAAPRGRLGGFWYWPIVGPVTVTGRSLTAKLGKPE